MLKTMALLRLLQRLWRQRIFLVCLERLQVSSKEKFMVNNAPRRII